MHTYSELRFTSSDGLTLAARDYPACSGPALLPVICIHGLTRNAADFDELAPWLSQQGRRVLAVDVRGRGQSDYDPNPANYQPMIYAGDIIRLADALGIARAVFIGTSMGGIITMTLAMRRLGLIAAAVLNDVGPALSPNGLARIASYAGKGAPVDSWQQAADYIRAINLSAFPDNSAAEWDKWARRAFAENAQGQLQLRYDPNIAQPLHAGKLKASSMMARMAFRRLANNKPTLLVRGALSDLIEPAQAAAMRRAAPALHYAEVPGVGHAPMLTEPAALNALQTFLAQTN